MGAKVTNWCDCCGIEIKNEKSLTGFWWGKPSEFKQYLDEIKAKNQADLCDECLKAVQLKMKEFIFYRN